MITVNDMGTALDKSDSLSWYYVVFFTLLGMPFLHINQVLTFAAVFAVILLIYEFCTGNYRIDRYAVVVLAFFTLGEAMALFKCPDLVRTLKSSVEKYFVILILYPLMLTTIDTEHKRTQACNCFKYGCLISAVFVWISYFTTIRIGFISSGFKTHRLILSGYGPNVVARLFCIGSLIALYQAQTSEKKRTRVIRYIEFIIIGFAVISTISMSGIILFLLGTIVIYCTYNNAFKRNGLLQVFLVVCIAAIAGLYLYMNVDQIRTIADNYLFRVNVVNQNDVTNGRMEGLIAAYNEGSSYCLFGLGYGCSHYLAGKTIHFPLIAALPETGLFGFISVVCQYGTLLHRDLSNLRYNSDFYAILSVLIMIGDMIQPNPNYLFTWFAIIIGAVPIYKDVVGIDRSCTNSIISRYL